MKVPRTSENIPDRILDQVDIRLREGLRYSYFVLQRDLAWYVAGSSRRAELTDKVRILKPGNRT